MSSKKYYMPWWTFGLMLLYLGFETLLNFSKQSQFQLYLRFFCMTAFAGISIRQIIDQRPQFSLKSIFIVNFVVAILCSIYLCFGLDVFYDVLLVLYCAGLIYAGTFLFKKKDGE